MVKIENKSTNRIRVFQIVLFLIQIFLTVTPFIGAGYLNSEKAYTVLGMMSYIGSTGDAQKLTVIGLCYSLFLIIPIVAVAFQIFDRKYNLKNVIGILASGAGVMLIIYFVGPAYISIGSFLALIIYLLTFFMSVMGIMARYVKTEENK